MSLSAPARRPDLFIIGAPKCGTTSLYEYLEGHPDIYMSPVKEPFYFAPDAVRTTHKQFIYGRDDAAYLALFAGARHEKHVGEASTRYMVSRAAPNLVHDFSPQARIVAIVRNPVEMLPALHNQRVASDLEPIVSFEEALAADEDRRAGRRLPAGTEPFLAVYREHARFGEQLQRWIDTFGRAALHIMVFDDFVTDTPGEFRRLLEFLEVDPDYRPSAFSARNQSHRPRAWSSRVIRARPVAWVAHTLMPGVLGEVRAAQLRRRMRHTPVVRRPYRREPITPELRHALEQEFAADVSHLSRLVGRDLGALWFGVAARE